MTGRVQLAPSVNDLAESVAFYTRLFGTEPAKVRPGYANFAIAEPPLKLVLLESPGQGGSLNHLGVEGEGGQQSWDATQAQLDGSRDQPGAQCCGGPQAASENDTKTGRTAGSRS